MDSRRGASDRKNNTDRDATLRAGVELGIWTFLGFSFQAIGLETTTASRSAFLLYLNVKLVPFFAAVFYGRTISMLTWVSAASALFGTALLSYDGAPPNQGDFWCICAAAASAMFILRLETFSKDTLATELNGVSFFVVTILCAAWVGGDSFFSSHGHQHFNFDSILSPFVAHPLPVIYLGFIATGICNFLQTIGQRVVAAEKAAIIYSLDPVYGAFFSFAILHETFGVQGFIGIAFVVLGVFISNSENGISKTVKDEYSEGVRIIDSSRNSLSNEKRTN